MESIALLLALFHYLRFLSLRLICCIFISPGFTSRVVVVSPSSLSLVNILHVVYFVRCTHTRLPFSCHSLLLSDSRLVGRVYISLYSIHHNFGCAYAYFFFLLHFPCIFRPLLLLLCRNDMRGRRRVSCIHATNEQKRDEKPTRSRAPLSREGRYFFVFFSMPSLLLRFVRTTAYR